MSSPASFFVIYQSEVETFVILSIVASSNKPVRLCLPVLPAPTHLVYKVQKH